MRIALAAALLLLSARAEAQTVIHDANRFRSPQHWALELRVGPYAPEVDSEFKGGADPHNKYFLDKRRPIYELELDYQFFRGFGSAAVGGQFGYFWEGAKAFNTAGTDRTGDSTALQLFPFAVELVYRMDEGARRWSIPVVPYVKAGLSYTLWRVTNANGDTASAGGQKGKGGTPGWQAAAGVSLLLDFLDPSSARALDSETGVNHTYLFAEIGRFEASGLGRKKALHVGDTTWVAGLMFEF